MGVDLDLEVSEEDRKFVESSASDNIGKLLDEFIGDKRSPERSVLKPVLKKPEDTVKRLATTTGRKLSFADDPPKSALSLMAAALKVPKHEIFVTELIILSHPIWVGDLRTKAKNRFLSIVRLLSAILFFYR
jgi:hypothetical protein